jgi:endonuclease G
MSEFHHLPPVTIKELVDALVAGGLATTRNLDSLSSNLNKHFASTLDDSGSPLPRLVRTLADLNSVRRIVDGSVPLTQWLAAAEILLASRPEVAVIRRALAAITNGASEPAEVIVDDLERAKDPTRSDMVPFHFLAIGARAGRSVARLKVPLIDAGTRRLLPSGEPEMDTGTGWLITPDLLVTNHHVIEARDLGESASDADLRAQAVATRVEFDYVTPDRAGTEVAVASLEAWSVTSALDYAILRLGERQNPDDRPPLRPLRERVTMPERDAPPVLLNIIQHPLGGPKMLAFRNNQLARVTQSELWYCTDTLRGSSGAPVLDDEWRVVALHKKWANAPAPVGALTWTNVGTRIEAILDDLKSRHPKLHDELHAH